MKPKPFSALNHLTVPCAMTCSPVQQLPEQLRWVTVALISDDVFGSDAGPVRAWNARCCSLRSRASCSGWVRPCCQALPRILFIFVPQAGQVPLAIRRPFVSVASAPITKIYLHFTQYPLYLSDICRAF